MVWAQKLQATFQAHSRSLSLCMFGLHPPHFLSYFLMILANAPDLGTLKGPIKYEAIGKQKTSYMETEYSLISDI